MITKEQIEKNEPVVLKWANVDIDPATKEVADGIAHGQADEFLSRIEADGEILGECRYIKMKGAKQNIEYLRVRARLQNLNQVSGGNKGAQVSNIITDLKETVPTFLRKEIIAHPYLAYAVIPETFMHDNVEQDDFMTELEALLSPSVAASADKIALYAKDDVSLAPEGKETDGMYASDGILTQLKEVKTAFTGNDIRAPRGFFTDIDTSKPLIPQISDMLKIYTKQRGKRSLATVYVDSDMLADLIDEASERQTIAGDKYTFDDGELRIRGRLVKELEALNEPENGFGRTVIIANWESVGYGPLHEVAGKSTFEHTLYSYLTSLKLHFGVVLIYPEDILAAKVVDITP